MILIDPELQAFALEVTQKVLPDVQEIVKVYKADPKEGVAAFYDFIERVKPSLERIIKGLRDPREVGVISPRLTRDPREVITHRRDPEEEETHVVGYLKAILQLTYCRVKGLEVWQFSNTPLYIENQKTRNVGKIDTLLSQIEIVKREISTIKLSKRESKSIEKEEIQIYENKPIRLQKQAEFNYLYSDIEKMETAVPFTARLMAYYRAQEYKNDYPLIVDPFAERLAGDLTSYANKHKFVIQRGDYPIVRAHYIEKNLLTPWCNTNNESQIVLVGAGLDTRAYRFEPLQTNKHTIFEIDVSSVISYKESILKSEEVFCDLVRIATDLSNPEWSSHLKEQGFLNDIPTFWIFEGLVYYMDQEMVVSLLEKASEMSTPNSQIFVDVCVPILADLVFGPFTSYFKWGLDKNNAPTFFAEVGWDVSCSYADDHDQGRDVGQRGLIFVHGSCYK